MSQHFECLPNVGFQSPSKTEEISTSYSHFLRMPDSKGTLLPSPLFSSGHNFGGKLYFVNNFCEEVHYFESQMEEAITPSERPADYSSLCLCLSSWLDLVVSHLFQFPAFLVQILCVSAYLCPFYPEGILEYLGIWGNGSISRFLNESTALGGMWQMSVLCGISFWLLCLLL